MAVVALLLCMGAKEVAAESWTQYQGDAAHTGHVPVAVDPTAIQPAWSATDSQLGQTSLRPGAVTDPDRVYLTGYAGSGTYEVLALDRQTGAIQWDEPFVPYGSQGLSQPSVGNGKVYVHQWGHSGSSGDPSKYPYVVGVDAETGAKQFATSHSGQWSSGSRPTVAGAQVFAAGGYYGGMDAYDGVTGAHSWFAKVNQQYGWIPAADEQRVYVYMGPASASPGPPTGTLYAVNRSSGTIAYTIQNPADSHTLYKGTVFLGQQDDALVHTYGQTITSFDLAGRTVRWRTSGNYNGSMAIDDGIVFAANGIQLDLLDEATGARLDQWFVPAGEYLTGNLLVTDNLIFAQTEDLTYALTRSTLEPVWSTDVVGDLALGDGVLLINNSESISAFFLPEPSTALFAFVAVLCWAGSRRHIER